MLQILGTLALGQGLMSLGAGVPGSEVLLVGEKGGTLAKVSMAAKGLGNVERQLPDGYFRLVLNPGVKGATAKSTLKKRGMDYVFDFDASCVDTTDLYSVREHIEYLEARHKLNAKPVKKKSNEPEETGVDFYEALEAYLRVRVGPDGKLNKAEMDLAIRQRDALPPASMGGGSSNAPYSIWAFVGPKNVPIPYSTYYGTGPLSGRKNDIAISPSNPSVMYVASAGGGIWKTTNAGTTWTPCSDKWAYLHTSSVAVHPTNPNIVLAGTGDYNGFFGKQTQGIMRSTDGGSTWTQVGTPTMKLECITKIIFNPANPSEVVCASGKGSTTQSGGIYKSTNGGVTWVATTWGADFDDMELGPTGTLWFAGVHPAHNNTGYIFRSTNFGTSWTAAPSNPCVNNQPALDIAVSRINGNTIYLLSTGDEAIYKSTDGGTTWSNIKGNFKNGYTGNANYNWSQKTYDQWLGCAVSGGQDILICGLIGINQSTGGGASWVDISRTYEQTAPNYVHSDQHSYAVHPTNQNIVYIGCDGGIFRYTYAANPTAANWTSLNATIYDMQHYQMSLHPTDLTYIMSGTQDNSSPSARGNLTNWTNLYAGDGAWSDFDQTNPGIHFTGSQNGSVWRYTSATDPSPDYISPPGWQGGFIAPAVFAGTGGSQIYLAGEDLQRWVSGTTWTTVKTGLTSGGNNYATTIGKSPNNTNVLYTGSTDGVIWRTLDNGATWKQIDDANIDRPVGDIAVSYTSDTDVLVGLQGTGPNHLWRCTNTSAAVPVWTNVSGNLPHTPINAVCFDPHNAGRWYVGTDIGVFMTSNSGASWTNLTYLGLPNVHVNALRVSKNKAYIYAATFGRGIWRIQTTSTPNPFSITGTVRTVGGAAFAGVSVALKKWREYSLTYTNSTPVNIPDNNTTGITSTLPISLNYPMTGGTLYLNITHTFRGDLEIILEAPDGSQWVVQNTSGDATDNIVGNFDFNKFASGLIATGTWKLKIRDLFPGDTGTLNSWKVMPKFFTYVTQSTTTTNGSGVYTFPGLDAGKYYVIPSFTGKTWTPAYRIMNVGPSRTGQDFQANQ